ncbi:TRIC cation channel family protein, partial [Klebsiella pneumoniae]|uniref:TRIC cation channel family protein n=1 Tax=Klebsiella pneumoniae TaxID=573 RepID=UPI003B5A9661
IGVNYAFLAGCGPLVAVCLGVVSGVGGGVYRVVLARGFPLFLRSVIFATACFVGGFVLASALVTFLLPLEFSAMMGLVVSLVFRLAGFR